MAKKQYKITVPKVGSNNTHGTEARLYKHNEVVDAKESWQEELMNTFVANGWAIETKMQSTVDVEQAEPVRARNDKGHYKKDDLNTPDVNEAYEGGKAPKANKRTTKKKTKAKA